jgi:hypothetical protein
MTLIFACATLAQLLTPVVPGGSAATACPVTIEVGSTDLLSACSVDPILQSGGAGLIFIPTHPPRDFVVERLDPKTVPGNRSGPELVTVTKRYFAGYPPFRYDFTGRHTFALDWCRVGETRPDGIEGCVVPPGVYRVSILYSLTDLRRGPGRERRLCRAYSPAFKPRESCGYTTYHSNIAAAKPNHPLQPTAGGRCEGISAGTCARRS